MIPERLRRNDDIETFIKDCQRFFELAQIPKKRQEIFIQMLMEKEMIAEYEAIDSSITGFEARLRKAFKKEKTLFEDLSEALEFRLGSETAETYFEKIENLTDRLLSHKWDKETLQAYLLVHCANDRDIKREVKMREDKTTEEIKKTIKKMVTLNRESEQINTIKSYKDATKRIKEPVPRYEPMSRRDNVDRYSRNYQEKSCWTCGKSGHINRDCKDRKPIRCYACGLEGHVRRECTKMQCTRCKVNGHKTEECYTNLEKRRQFNEVRNSEWYENRNRNRNWNNKYQRDTSRETERYNHDQNQNTNRNREQYNRNNRGRQIATMMDEDTTRDRDNESEHPNDNASTAGNMIGAVY